MCRIHPKVKKAALAEAELHGCTLDFKDGTKHVKIDVTYNGNKRVITVAPKNGSHRPELTADWVRQDIRKIIKEMDLTKSSSRFTSNYAR